MSFPAFLSAVLALLLAPGPTNTLMGVAGAQGGLGRVARLLPAELLGYLTTILPLVYLRTQALDQWPAAAVALKVAAAAWVMVLAIRLWDMRGGAAAAGVDARQVYLTTMLNPKALIFGLVVFSTPEGTDFAWQVALFALLVSGVALVWGAAGAFTQAGSGGASRLRLVQRIASVWLACVSITLIAGVITA